VKKIIVVLLVVIVALNWGKIRSTFEPRVALPPIKEGEVVLYSTSWCGYCKATRNLFAHHGVTYVEYDIERSAHGKKMHSALGGGGVPVIEIRNEVIRGYDEKKILAALKG
jgi:mycoredoxin